MDPFSASSGLAWLATPGQRQLPSGVAVDVGPVEGGEVTVSVGGGVCVVVSADDTDDPPIQVSLHWLASGNVRRPYDCEAVVTFEPGEPAALTVRSMPGADHQRTCDVCPLDPTPTLIAGVDAHGIQNFVEFVAGLPRHRGYWAIDAAGVGLWRGRTDGKRRALIELIPPDDSDWHNNDDWRDRSFEVIAVVPIPFDTWPHNVQ